jgi:hypothetical protein
MPICKIIRGRRIPTIFVAILTDNLQMPLYPRKVSTSRSGHVRIVRKQPNGDGWRDSRSQIEGEETFADSEIEHKTVIKGVSQSHTLKT